MRNGPPALRRALYRLAGQVHRGRGVRRNPQDKLEARIIFFPTALDPALHRFVLGFHPSQIADELRLDGNMLGIGFNACQPGVKPLFNVAEHAVVL